MISRMGHYLVTITPGLSTVDPYAHCYRYSDTVSSNGNIVTVSKDTYTWEYPPMISNLIEISEGVDMEIGLSISVPDTSLDQEIVYGAAVEVSWLHEGDTWDSRRIYMSGRVTSVTPASSGDMVTLYLDGSIDDQGRIYDPSDVLSSSRFTDIGSTDEASRARYAAGIYPPIIFCPIDPPGQYPWQDGSSYLSPMIPVQDYDLSTQSFARYLIAGSTLVLSNTTVKFVDPQKNSDLITYGNISTTSATEGRYPMLSDTDLTGRTYTYVLGKQYDLASYPGVADQIVGDVTITGIPDTISFLPIFEHDLVQVKSGTTLPSDTSWRMVESADSTNINVTTSIPSTISGGNVYRIRHPAGQAHIGYVDPSLFGGVTDLSGTPIHNPMDICIWMLSRSSLTIPIDYGSFAGLRGRCEPYAMAGTVIYDGGSPLDFIVSEILPAVPVSLALRGGHLTAVWDGPDTLSRVYDLSPQKCSVWREGKVVSTGVPDLKNQIKFSYRYDMFRNRNTSVISIGSTYDTYDGIGGFSLPITLPLTSCLESQQRYGVRTLEVGSEWVQNTQSALASATIIAKKVSTIRKYLTLKGYSDLTWIPVDSYVRIKDDPGIDESQVWRIRTRTLVGDGSVEWSCISIL